MNTLPPAARARGRVITAAASAAAVVAVAGSVAATAYAQAGSAGVPGTLSFALAVITVAVVGAVISLAVPDNRVGWLLLASASLMGTGLAFMNAGAHGIVTAPGSVPEASYLAALGIGLSAAGMLVAVICVPAVFPDGRLPGRRWHWLGWCAGAAVCSLFLGNILSPDAQQARLGRWRNPLALPGGYGHIADALSAAGVLLAAAGAAGTVAGLVVRWRRGGPLARQQLLLLALAICPPVLLFLVILPTNGVPGWLFGLVLLPLPVAIAVAVLAHGLYDLRRAAQRTLLWLAMSGFVVGIYAVVMITAVGLVPDHHTWWPSALAAAVAALALIPVHGKLQHAVTRVVYGRWREPYEVLAGLGERLEAAADIDRLLAAVVAELTTGLELREVGVCGPDGAIVVGMPAGDPAASVPLLAYGVAVGRLTYRAPDRELSAAEQRLVRDLARQLGGALHARLLHADLQRARERLVLAREEERRRLRRDLHDGLGPALAGLTLKTETARALLPPRSQAASRQLHDLGEEIRQTVLDVRRLVEGLRPPALDELGLVSACTQAVGRLTAGTSLAATVHSQDDLPALPAAVEVAAYRIVVEAVTNTVRHAGARHVRVRLSHNQSVLSVAVADDGAGLPGPPGPGNGHGLAIMRERAEELGGILTVRDASPGVAVAARLPAAAVVAPPASAPAIPA